MVREQVNLAVPSEDSPSPIDEDTRVELLFVVVHLDDAPHKDVTVLFTSELCKDISGTSWNGLSHFEIPAVSEELRKNDEVSIRFF
jgi:hypothetical protein